MEANLFESQPAVLPDNGVAAVASPDGFEFSGYDKAMAEISHQQQVEAATTSEKWKGFSDTWDSTYVARAYDYAKNDFLFMFEDSDPEWLKTNSSNMMAERLNRLDIQPKYYRQFADAKSEPHFRAIQQRIQEAQRSEKNINDTLNNYGGLMTERSLSTFATNFADIDVITSGGLAMANKMNGLRRLMLTNKKKVYSGLVGIHGATAAAAYETDPAVGAGEAVFFASIGSVADMAQIKYYNHKALDVPDDVQTGKSSPITDSETDPFVMQSTLDRIRKNKGDDVDMVPFQKGIDDAAEAGVITKDEAATLTAGLSNKKTMDRTKVRFLAKDNGDGTVSINGSKKRIAIAALLGLGATAASADEDGVVEIVATGIGAITVLAAMGLMGGSALKKVYDVTTKAQATTAIKNFFTGIPEWNTIDVDSFKGGGKTQKVYTFEDARKAIFETIEPLRKTLDLIPQGKKYVKEKALKLINDMLFDTGSGQSMTMERNRDRMFHSWDNMILNSMNNSYKLWRKNLDNVAKYNSDEGYFIGSRNAFEQEVFNHMTGIKISDNEFVKEAAASVNKTITVMETELKEARDLFRQKAAAEIERLTKELDTNPSAKAGIETIRQQLIDIQKIKLSHNNIRTQSIRVLSTNIDGKGREALINIVADVYGRSTAFADKLIRVMSNNPSVRAFMIDGEIVFLDDLVPNFSKWKDFDYELLDGTPARMSLKTLFETNPTTSMSTTAKNLAGHIAFMDKSHTVKSIDDLIASLKANGVPKTTTDALDDTKNLILGNPILDQSSDLSKWRRELTNLTIGATMGLSVLSQLPEALRLLFSKGNPIANLSNSVSVALGKYKYKEVLLEMIEDMGLAQDSKGLTFGAIDHIGDNNINVQTNRVQPAQAAASRATEVARDTSLFMMVHTSDLLTKIAMMKNVEWLNDIVNGTVKLSPDRMNIFGLNAENMAMFKKHLKLEKGKKLGLADWSREDRLEFYKVMQNMTMKDVQNTTLGNAPQWTRTSELGMAISLLTRHSIGAVANHGIYGLKGMVNGDLFSVGRENVSMFIGGYVAAMLRDTLKDKEPDHAKYAAYAFMGLGLAQPFEIIKSLADPALFSQSAKIAETTNDALLETVGAQQ